MERELINEYTMNKSINMEFARKAYQTYQKGNRVVSFLLFFFLMMISVSSLFTESVFFAVLMVPASLVFLFMGLRGYIFGTGSMYRAMEDLYGKDFTVTVKLYEDHIESNTTASSLSLSYDKITEMLETPRLFALMVGKQGMQQRGVIVMKDAFTKGTEAEFRAFVQEKGVKLRR